MSAFYPIPETVCFSKDGICANERNIHIPAWDHRLQMKALPNGSTQYSDEAEIDGGRKTGMAWLWARSFYAHRQKKWIEFLSERRDKA